MQRTAIAKTSLSIISPYVDWEAKKKG